MSTKEITLNHIPSPTWRWLKMNHGKITAFDASGATHDYTEKIPSSIDKTKADKAEYDNIKASLGADFDEIFNEAVTETSKYVIKPGVKESLPLVLRFNYGEHAVNANRFVFETGENAELTVLMDFASDGCGDEENVSMAKTLVKAGKNSKVSIIQVTRLGENNRFFNDIGIETDDNAEIKIMNLFVGGDVYQGCRVTLSGEASKVEKNIGYFLNGNDKLDMNYIVDHIAPNTECNIDAQGVLQGTSEKVFRGTIDFKNGCAGAVGGEIENVLMRSDDVICRSIPVILCSEEDVAGNHGASIGKLDEDLLFYMSSRGLKEDDIYDIISDARLRGFCRQIPDDEVRRDARKSFNGGIETDE